jgi:membrane protein implicated in regulation of membrane protease activity
MSDSKPATNKLSALVNQLNQNKASGKQAIRKGLLNFQKSYLIPLTNKLSDIRAEPEPLWKRLFSPQTLLWLGISAGITGLLILISPETFSQWQLLLIPIIAFIGSNLVALFQDTFQEAQKDYETYHGERLLGKTFVLKKPITNGETTILIEHKKWTLKGNDCPAGIRVKIVAVGEETLHVVPHR